MMIMLMMMMMMDKDQVKPFLIMNHSTTFECKDIGCSLSFDEVIFLVCLLSYLFKQHPTALLYLFVDVYFGLE